MGQDAQEAKETELGTASCFLPGLLEQGQDLVNAKLPVVDANGGEMGTFTCSVSAVDALRVIAALAVTALPKGEAESQAQ